MSYCNAPLRVPSTPSLPSILYDMNIKYLQQHATMVDLLLNREMSRNGWSINATPYAPPTNDNEINSNNCES